MAISKPLKPELGRLYIIKRGYDGPPRGDGFAHHFKTGCVVRCIGAAGRMGGPSRFQVEIPDATNDFEYTQRQWVPDDDLEEYKRG